MTSFDHFSDLTKSVSFTRDIHDKSMLYNVLSWVWVEHSHASPPTQSLFYIYYLCLCRLHYSSLPFLPIVLFSLSLGGNPLFGELAHLQLTLAICTDMYWELWQIQSELISKLPECSQDYWAYSWQPRAPSHHLWFQYIFSIMIHDRSLNNLQCSQYFTMQLSIIRILYNWILIVLSVNWSRCRNITVFLLYFTR